MRQDFAKTIMRLTPQLKKFFIIKLSAAKYKGDWDEISRNLIRDTTFMAYEVWEKEEYFKNYTDDKLVFVRAWNAWTKFTKSYKREKASGYLESFAHLQSPDPDPLMRVSRKDALQKIIIRFPEDIARMFQRLLEGATYSELAEENKLTCKKIRQRLYYWRDKL